jgi:hypothetical protein
MRGCSPTAGAATRWRRESIPTTTATPSPSTTTRALTSILLRAASGTARTSATVARAWSPTTGTPGNYSYFTIDTSPDAVNGPGAALKSASGVRACPSSSAITVHLAPVHGAAITRVRVFLDGRLVLTARGRSLHSVTLGGLPGSGAHHLRLWVYMRHGLARRTSHMVYGCLHRAAAKKHPRTHHRAAKHRAPSRRHARDHDGDYDGN